MRFREQVATSPPRALISGLANRHRAIVASSTFRVPTSLAAEEGVAEADILVDQKSAGQAHIVHGRRLVMQVVMRIDYRQLWVQNLFSFY